MNRLWKRPCFLLHTHTHTHGIPPHTQQQMVRAESESNFRRSDPRGGLWWAGGQGLERGEVWVKMFKRTKKQWEDDNCQVLPNVPPTCTHAKSLQSCQTVCDPMDCSPPGSSVHGILQAWILEWVAFLSPGDLPDPGIVPRSPTLQADFFFFFFLPFEPPGKPKIKQ